MKEINPITGHEPKLVSAMLEEEFKSSDKFVSIDEPPTTFFAPAAKLNESAMIEYGIKDDALDRRYTMQSDNSHGGPDLV